MSADHNCLATENGTKSTHATKHDEYFTVSTPQPSASAEPPGIRARASEFIFFFLAFLAGDVTTASTLGRGLKFIDKT